MRPARAGAVERLRTFATGDGLWVGLAAGGALLGPALLASGWDYYRLPSELRPGAPLDDALRPGGSVGLGLGIAGTALFLLNLTYVLRRRFGLLERWISMRLWLNVHVVCGATGGSLILVHSALNAGNRVARLAALAIAVAVASGIFGRYVLAHLPRGDDGAQADRRELAGNLAAVRGELRRRLAAFPRARSAALAALELGEAVEPREATLLGALAELVVGDVRAAWRSRRTAWRLRWTLRRAARDPEVRALVAETVRLVLLHGRASRRLAQVAALRDLMDTWRSVHLVLALVMVLATGLHVGVVLTYGRIAVGAP